MSQAVVMLEQLDQPPENRSESRGATPSPSQVRTITLLDLVMAIAEAAENEAEVVATVTHLVNSGQVQLVGNFRGADVRIA